MTKAVFKKETLHLKFKNYLKTVGLKNTKQRTLILDALLSLDDHVDVPAIVHKVQHQDSSIGVATVYRTLQLMVDGGIILERQFGKERKQFECMDPEQEHHDHLICLDCGQIMEFYNQPLEQLQDDIAHSLGFQLSHHTMQLFGSCLDKNKCKHLRKK